jgi:hypothetical protein
MSKNMTLEEIKRQVLKLIEPDASFTETIDSYMQDENYKGYLESVVPSINRAVARMIALDKIPYKTHTIAYTSVDTTITSNYKTYNLDSLITDFNKVIAITRDDNPITFKIIGSTLYIPRNKIGTYVVVYSPIPSVIVDTDDSLDLSTIGIPNRLANIIPYYVVADLLEDNENYTLANTSRNYFEEYLNAFDNTEVFNMQGDVENVFY